MRIRLNPRFMLCVFDGVWPDGSISLFFLLKNYTYSSLHIVQAQDFLLSISRAREMSREKKNPSNDAGRNWVTHLRARAWSASWRRDATYARAPSALFMRTLMILFNDPYWSDSRLYTFFFFGNKSGQNCKCTKEWIVAESDWDTRLVS